MREFEVLQLLASGKSDEDITEATFISAVLAFIGQSRDSALSCPDYVQRRGRGRMILTPLGEDRPSVGIPVA